MFCLQFFKSNINASFLFLQNKRVWTCSGVLIQTNEFQSCTMDDIEQKITCAICGAFHSTVSCDYTTTTNYIYNRTIPTKARLTLPNDFVLNNLSDGRYRIVTNVFIQKGTRLGPLDAAKSFTLNPAIQFPLKIFPFGEDIFLEYYLDNADEDTSTWMMFIEPAEYYEEQNLICYQEEQYIYYIALKDINENESLKVWYAPYYASKMDKPLLEKKKVADNLLDITALNKLVKSQQNIPDTDSWTCKFCNVIIKEITKFANHLIEEHYRSQLKNKCKGCKAISKTQKCICKRQEKVKHPYRNNKILTVDNIPVETSSDRISSREISIGDPLLNCTTSFDNLDNSEFMPSLYQISEDSQILCVENFNTENLLMAENFKSLADFNFDIEEMKEGIGCDICFKNFTSLPNLIQHLRGHRGEYYCSSCNKVFSRKENLRYHSCTKNFNYTCSSCNRNFSQQKYYKRHIDVVHNHKFKCNYCLKKYSNKYELNKHTCTMQEDQYKMYVCGICKKLFSQQRWLNKHISRQHTNNKMFICEICSKQYTTKFLYDIHVRTHKEPKFKCEICLREFHRKDVLKKHIINKHKNGEFSCDKCNRKFKSKEYLLHHQAVHMKAKYNCNICNSSFKTKSNLIRHSKIHQKKGDTPKSELLQCNFCEKRLKLKSSLVRHIHKKHISENKVSQNAVEVNNDGEKDILHFLSDDLNLMADSQDNVDSVNVAVDDLGRKQIQVIDNILLTKSEEMGLGINSFILNSNAAKSKSQVKMNENVKIGTEKVKDRDMFLSMPDLMEIENDIISGEGDFLRSLR